MATNNNKHNAVSTTVELITPERAQSLLGRVNNVRSVRRDFVSVLAAAMKTPGLWEMNGASIKINAAGFVVDGEHRLRACVLANVPFRTLVTYGIEQCATIDTGGRTRTAGQLVGNIGIKHATVAASLARLALILERDGNLDRCSYHSFRTGLSVQVIHDYCARNAAAVAEAAALGYRPAATTRLPGGAFSLVAYVAAGSPRMLSFLEAVRTGEHLAHGDPAMALRERAFNLGRGARVSFFHGTALVLKAWNAYARHEKLRVVKVGPSEGIQTPISA